MAAGVEIRPVRPTDYDAWLPLWNGYNEFYGRVGATALDPAITEATWKRFFDPGEPVFALVADTGGPLAGLAHFLHHRSTMRPELVCYLQDLYTAPAADPRGQTREPPMKRTLFSLSKPCSCAGPPGCCIYRQRQPARDIQTREPTRGRARGSRFDNHDDRGSVMAGMRSGRGRGPRHPPALPCAATMPPPG